MATHRFMSAMTLLGLLVLGIGTALADKKADLVGDWVSFAYSDPETVKHIKSITMSFKKEDKLTVTVVPSSGKVDSRTGTYRVISDTHLELTVVGEKPERMLFSLKDGVLKLTESKIDSWIKFRRAKPAA